MSRLCVKNRPAGWIRFLVDQITCGRLGKYGHHLRDGKTSGRRIWEQVGWKTGKRFFGNMMFSHDGNMMMIEVF